MNWSGDDAQAETWNHMTDAGPGALQYARAAVADPSVVASDLGKAGRKAIEDMSPLNPPMSGSLGDVARHQFSAGANLGETATNIVGTLAGGEVLGGLRAA